MDNQVMAMNCATNEYEMIDKGESFNNFEVIVGYSGITNWNRL